MKVKKFCVICDKEIEIKEKRDLKKQTCSRACSGKLCSKRAQESKPRLNCQVCGKEYIVIASRKDTAKTCSLECKGKLRTQDFMNARIRKICPECGQEFSFPSCHKDRRKFCSDECARKSRMVHITRLGSLSGEDSPAYKTGITKHIDGYVYKYAKGHPFANTGDNRYVFEHRLVMESRMRDCCPDHKFLTKMDGKLYLKKEIVVHHIDKNRSNNDIDNLLAVTHGAHLKIHRWGNKPGQHECWPPNPERF